MTKSIIERKCTIDKTRSDFMRNSMQAYDENVYRPAMRELQKECEVQGHSFTILRRTIHGSCYLCSSCGAWEKAESED